MPIAPADAVEQIGGMIEVARRLGGAALVGAIIGTNRELHDKPAGTRTHALVALGAALVAVGGLFLDTPGSTDAASRVIQGIITGIGFIGGGVILRDERGLTVHGLTTAATLWVSACLGILCGLGHWATAILAVALALVVLVLGHVVEMLLRRVAKRSGSGPRPEP